MATTQKPLPGSPPPPPARASCHVAQGRGARHCGAGSRGGPYQRPPPRHPCRAVQWFRSSGTRANSKRPFPGFSNQSNAEAKQAAGKPTPPKGRVAGRPRWSQPSLTLLSLSSPLLEADRARRSNSPHLPTQPHPGSKANP